MTEELEVALITFRDSLDQKKEKSSYGELTSMQDKGYVKLVYGTDNSFFKGLRVIDSVEPSSAGKLILGLSQERDELLQQVSELKERLGDVE